MVDQPNEIHCELCSRENEEEQATNFCFSCKGYICKSCTAYHTRNMASRDHTLFTAIELKSMQVVPEVSFSKLCRKHKHVKIQIYCHDHEH